MKLHREGKATIIIAFLALILFGGAAFFFLEKYHWGVTLPLFILFGLVLWFFRVPERNILEQVENVLAPVDGKVVMIKEVEENEILKTRCIQVSIFMSPLNVHICRYPVTGMVFYKKYHPGKYLMAWNEKSSTENERTTIAVDTLTNHKVAFRQIEL